MDVSPTPVDIPLGGSAGITFDTTALPAGTKNATVIVLGLESEFPGNYTASGDFTPGSNGHLTTFFNDVNTDKLLNLGIGTNPVALGAHVLQTYLIGNGGGQWNAAKTFTVNVTEAVPEPSTILLMGLGLGLVGLCFRRRRQ